MTNEQAEPVGYFVNDESDDQWHQVNYEQRNGADTYPLYLHPPADAPQQAEPRDVCDVCNALTVPRNATHYDADDLKAAQVRGKIIAAKLQQQVEPVAQIGWADEFGNLFPRGAWKPAQRTHHDSHKAAWRPVFLHPPAAPQGEESDAAYTERNHLVALLSTLYPAGKARTAIEGWSPEWHGCVYIDFPWGQASWHYHDRDAGLFNHLAPYRGSWDGHTTEAKYDLIRQAVAAPQQAEPVWVRPDQLQKARQAPFLCRVSPTKDSLDLVPLYLHPPAAEVQRLRDAAKKVIDAYAELYTCPEEIIDLRRALEGLDKS